MNASVLLVLTLIFFYPMYLVVISAISCPSEVFAGKVLLFPTGYSKVSQQGTDPYLFRINRAKQLVGQGSGSMILLDATIPATTDVFLIQPDVGAATDGYGISGLHVAARVPRRLQGDVGADRVLPRGQGGGVEQR